MKGIILAGGEGSRLYPLTKAVSKQLLPVYDQPMIYYPISVLMVAGITEILIITTPDHKKIFENLLGDGSNIGLNLSYTIQDKPRGLADAFILGEEFIGNDSICLMLGDNLLYGDGLTKILKESINQVEDNENAVVFGYYVNKPEDYGIIQLNQNGEIVSIEEKPSHPTSNYAIIGLYFYPNNVIQLAKKVKPSLRGEIEITSINQAYLNNNKIKANLLGRGFTWMDTGTHESLLEASQLIKSLEKRTGLKIGCLEEIAFNKGLISQKDLKKSLQNIQDSPYKNYILKLVTRNE
ncbi:MAG: glucose-1-phosphate thymidylyltransferase [Chloroflexi bacterium]|jgi:glucose-1-phosphate thymidylyltransferase|nr:glucose-1-phosphate thymidylyltransferase [Chloroflexota bacterium]